ncbi:MAG TPA: hypothetical protein VGD50_05480, partial [Candidatus Baltobacteraceae bacterium]
YGPGFIVYIKLLVGGLHSPIGSITLMRTANAAWFLLLLALLRAAGVGAAALCLAALNPAILFAYVANPHNDLIACTLVIAALAVAVRLPLLAAVIVVAASLVKLPFAVIGCLAFTQLRSVTARACASIATVAAGVGASYILAGPAYFQGLSYYSHLLAHDGDGAQWLATVIALGALAAAVLLRRYGQVTAYALPALPVVELEPWYAIWSLPYAVCERTHLHRFLILLPVMLALMETGIAQAAQLTLYGLIVAAIGAGMIRDMRRAQHRSQPVKA